MSPIHFKARLKRSPAARPFKTFSMRFVRLLALLLARSRPSRLSLVALASGRDLPCLSRRSEGRTALDLSALLPRALAF